MKQKHTGQLFAKVNGSMIGLDITGSDYNRIFEKCESLQKSLEFWKEANSGYASKIEEKANHINALETLTESLQATVKQQDAVIRQYRTEMLQLQSKLEEIEQAHVQERVGMLERFHDKVIDQETVIQLHEHGKDVRND